MGEDLPVHMNPQKNVRGIETLITVPFEAEQISAASIIDAFISSVAQHRVPVNISVLGETSIRGLSAISLKEHDCILGVLDEEVKQRLS